MPASTKSSVQQKYLAWLNKEPREVLLAPDKSAEYVPIQIVQEDLLEGYKGQTKFEIHLYQAGEGWWYGSGAIHYRDPVSKEWLFQAGQAAVPKSKSFNLDFPALGAHILLNACKKIGKRFGRDLNRTTELRIDMADNFNNIGSIELGSTTDNKRPAPPDVLAKFKSLDTQTQQLYRNVYIIPQDAEKG